MKDYFIQFNYFNSDFNKFYYGIVSVDLKENDLTEVCRRIVDDEHHDIGLFGYEIKVCCLNNIEV